MLFLTRELIKAVLQRMIPIATDAQFMRLPNGIIPRTVIALVGGIGDKKPAFFRA
jgi:hypothetical protein